MTTVLPVSKGDTTPLRWTVKDSVGKVRPITGGTVKIRVGRIGRPNAKFEAAMNFDSEEGEGDGSDGKVVYTPLSTHFDTAGYFDAEIRVTFSDASVCANQFTIHVLDTLNTVST